MTYKIIKSGVNKPCKQISNLSAFENKSFKIHPTEVSSKTVTYGIYVLVKCVSHLVVLSGFKEERTITGITNNRYPISTKRMDT